VAEILRRPNAPTRTDVDVRPCHGAVAFPETSRAPSRHPAGGRTIGGRLAIRETTVASHPEHSPVALKASEAGDLCLSPSRLRAVVASARKTTAPQSPAAPAAVPPSAVVAGCRSERGLVGAHSRS
jgi:hypothetical protein